MMEKLTTRSLGVVFALVLVATGCQKTPPKAVVKKSALCTLSDSSGCAVRSPRPKQTMTPVRPENEVSPFYESLSDSAIDESPTGNQIDEVISQESERPEENEEVIGQEAEREINKSNETLFGSPVEINDMMEKWIVYFQTRGRDKFVEYLARSGRYVPMMRRILRENGLPEDLVYLSMIESGFKPYAYSRAKASGPWQFMKGTGKLYGLRYNWWIDERRDPEKSSIAAAQHLKDLYDQFGHWYLAAAGYNAGAGKITKAIRKYSTEDFWELSKSRYRYLRSETKNYVPKMLAAAIIAKDPKRFGFTDIQYETPLEYETVTIPEATELRAIAETISVSHDQLLELNPELRRDITPPDMPNYELKVPKGYASKVLATYPEIRKKSADGARRHVARRGETIASIARLYHIDPATLADFNRLPSPPRIRSGMQLAVPIWGGPPTKSAAKQPVFSKFASEEEPTSTYRVRSGDTLWSISRRFNVSVSEIRHWNNLSDSGLRPGKKLRLIARTDPPMLEPANRGGDETPEAAKIKPKPETTKSAGGWTVHKVEPGESLWTIAKRYKVSIGDLTQWNNIEPDEKLYPGFELKIRAL